MKKQLAIVALAGVLLFPSLGLAQTQNASTTEQTTQYLIDSLRAELQALLMDLVQQLQAELLALTERVDAVAPEGDDDDDGGVAQQQQAQSDDDDEVEEIEYKIHASVLPELGGPDNEFTGQVIAQVHDYWPNDSVEVVFSEDGGEAITPSSYETKMESCTNTPWKNNACATYAYYPISEDRNISYIATITVNGEAQSVSIWWKKDSQGVPITTEDAPLSDTPRLRDWESSRVAQ